MTFLFRSQAKQHSLLTGSSMYLLITVPAPNFALSRKRLFLSGFKILAGSKSDYTLVGMDRGVLNLIHGPWLGEMLKSCVKWCS